MEETLKDLLTAGQAAELVGVDKRTIRTWGDSGKLPMVVTLGGHRRFRRADVERLLEPKGSE